MKQRINLAKMPWQGQLFAFLQGSIGKAFVEGDAFLKSQLDRTLWYDGETETYVGSNHSIVTRADSRARELSHGVIRAVSLQDTDNSTFKDMIYGKYYADVPEAIIQTPDGDFANQVVKIVSKKDITLNLPCKVTGLDVKIGENGSPQYSARDDFALTQHDSLKYSNGKERFNKLENGFPVFDDNGKYTWYLRSDNSVGVSRGSGFGVNGGVANFGDSGRVGRVGLTAAAGSAPKIVEDFVNRLQSDFESQKKDAESRYTEARKLLLGKE